jgi:hypothetical protein
MSLESFFAARADALRALCASRDEERYMPGCRVWLMGEGQPAHPLYPIPEELLGQIQHEAPGFFTNDELEVERVFAEGCRRRDVPGVWRGRMLMNGYASAALFPPPGPLPVPDAAPGQPCTTVRTSQVRRQYAERAPPARLCLEAYLGWLLTNPEFLTERDALRERHDAALRACTTRIWPLPSTGDLHRCPHGPDGLPADTLPRDFLVFYRRWELATMTTWELPQPAGVNLGGPAVPAHLLASEDAPAVQLPATVRLPDRYPLREVLRGHLDPHLAEWKQVLDQRHPAGRRFEWFKRAFRLLLLHQLTLAAGYPERVAGRLERLEHAYARYLGTGQESVRKLRQSIERRLRPPAAS